MYVLIYVVVCGLEFSKSFEDRSFTVYFRSKIIVELYPISPLLWILSEIISKNADRLICKKTITVLFILYTKYPYCLKN